MTERNVHVHLYLTLPPGTTLHITAEGTVHGDGAVLNSVTGGDVTVEALPEDPAEAEVARVVTALRGSLGVRQAVAGLRELGYVFRPQHPRNLPGNTGSHTNYVRFAHPDGWTGGYLYPTYFKYIRAADVERLAGLPGAERDGGGVKFSHRHGAGPGLAAAALLVGRDDWAAAALAHPGEA